MKREGVDSSLPNRESVWRKGVTRNEEMGEHHYAIGDFGSVFFWVCRGVEGRKSQMPQVRCCVHSG